MLQNLNNSRSNIYAKLGLSFMKCFRIDLAIDYLTIANFLAKEENSGYDYSDLILRLKGYITKDDSKPLFKMTQEEFDYSDINDYYGIDNFEEINEFISNSGLDVESACKELNMTSEETDIVILLFAREFYCQGNNLWMH